MGGKGRIAKDLSTFILETSFGRETYIEPFVGGGAMAAKMGNHFDTAIYADIHPDLVMMWEATLNQGWEPPTNVSYDLYQKLRYTEHNSPLRGFVGFGGSFGGRWFEGYARGGKNANGEPRNHQAESARAVLKDAATMRARHRTLTFCADALQLQVIGDEVIYCDPPYAGTKNYSRTAPFDHEAFWKKAQEWAEAGAEVYVSSYEAPEGWVSVWSQPLRSSVRVGSEDRHVATERLFMWDEAIDRDFVERTGSQQIHRKYFAEQELAA